MRPENLKTKIFLDGGDPNETKQIIEKLGFLDGQTTNPTLISKNPDAQKHLEAGEKFEEKEIYDFYKKVVSEISPLVKESVSIEVYVDEGTPQEKICKQAEEMNSWIPNAHIKYPITRYGLACAHKAIADELRVNMTLCFSQEQAAAVHAATRGAKEGQVYVSPFIGRLDDIGENGMDVIENILKMFREQNSHVQTLVASVRSIDHFMRALQLEADIITAPFKILNEWVDHGALTPGDDFVYAPKNLKPIKYREFDLSQNWESFDISHPLTDKGIKRFAKDWNSLIT